MRCRRSCWWPVAAVALILLSVSARGEEPKVLLDVSRAAVEKQVAPTWGTGDQVSVNRSEDPAAPGMLLAFKTGPAGYPGVQVKPQDAASWDLSAYGHVEVRVVNTGTKGSSFALRVDNNSDGAGEPWNAEQTYLLPGQAATLSVIFGHSYGYKPAYPLKPDAVVGILMFTSKADQPQSFRVERLVAAGPAGEKPPVDPNSIRLRPSNGLLLGTGLSIDAPRQIEATGGAKASMGGDSAGLHVAFAAGSTDQAVVLKPAVGRWDLRDATEIRIQVKNEGTTAVTPRVQALSDGNGSTAAVSAASALAPGSVQEIVVPFAAAVTWKGIPNSGDRTTWDGQANTGTHFRSDAVAAIRITATQPGAAALLVQSITAAAPVAELPEWLGQRPPVEGNWVKTFDDEFDGAAVDPAKWNVAGPNFWDQASHWSKDNVLVGGGLLKMRYQKKTGHHNDDPAGKQTPYASGYLDTYGKWVQRYGYFEAKMKLPTAPGLWPAFWLMPDRGVQAGEQWQRQDTANGGMEFDVMEHLTRWGPHRYNIAMHWDGYSQAHKQTGSECLYVQADPDGFITCGLLWLPGMAVYYCNGREVARWEDPRISKVASDLMFTLPMGGWDNSPIDDAQLPAEFVIKYVRVWQRSDLREKP